MTRGALLSWKQCGITVKTHNNDIGGSFMRADICSQKHDAAFEEGLCTTLWFCFCLCCFMADKVGRNIVRRNVKTGKCAE